LGALDRQQVQSSDVYSMLGLVETDMIFELVNGLCTKDCAKALETFHQIIERGKDVRQLAKDLTEHYRHLMVIKIGGKSVGKLIDYPVTQKEMLLEQSQKLSLAEILKSLEYLIEAQDVARITENSRMPLELAFAKMTYETKREAAAVSAVPLKEATAVKATVKPTAPVSAVPNSSAPVKTNDVRPSKDVQSHNAAAADPVALAPEQMAEQEPQSSVAVADDLTIDDIRSSWNSLTHEVSRHKMSVATYLQDGNPYSYKDGKLVIGFASDHTFNKESLEHKDNLRIVMDVFSEKLRRSVVIQLKIIEEYTGPTIDPNVDKALNMFKGKVVNQWHND
jgi:DNA polymerase-3 subunit gamma/tau